MEINYHLLNLLIVIALFVYLIYLLFFVNQSMEIKNLITNIINNKFIITMWLSFITLIVTIISLFKK